MPEERNDLSPKMIKFHFCIKNILKIKNWSKKTELIIGKTIPCHDGDRNAVGDESGDRQNQPSGPVEPPTE